MRLSLFIMATAAALSVSGQVYAQGRPDARTMTCQETRQVIERNGGAVLTTGRHTYDRYVNHSGQCVWQGEIARPAYIETRDSPSCQVNRCVRFDPRELFGF